jgi:hypothetical protein
LLCGGKLLLPAKQRFELIFATCHAASPFDAALSPIQHQGDEISILPSADDAAHLTVSGLIGLREPQS